MDFLVTQLRVAQAGHRIILIEALLGLGSGFDVPLNQTLAEAERHLLGEHGLAGTRLTLDQQRARQSHRSVYCHAQIISRDVALSSLEFHHLFHTRKKQSRKG